MQNLLSSAGPSCIPCKVTPCPVCTHLRMLHVAVSCNRAMSQTCTLVNNSITEHLHIVNKSPHIIELRPHAGYCPGEWTLNNKTKTLQRYSVPEFEDLSRRLQHAQEDKQAALHGVLAQASCLCCYILTFCAAFFAFSHVLACTNKRGHGWSAIVISKSPCD